MAGAGLLRGLRRSAVWRAALARIGAGYIRLIAATTRWQVEGQEGLDRLAAAPGGFIAAFWHGRLLMSPTWPLPGRARVAMISNNRDGELIAAVVARFGARCVRGSTYDRAKRRDKGGALAYAAAQAALAEGAAVGITPDGPRGPRMRAQAGVAQLSIAMRAPVLPVAYATRWGVLTRSWDRFLLPLPFSRGALVYGVPLLPPEGEDAATLERHRRAIEAALTAVTHRADALCGRPPVPPAEEAGDGPEPQDAAEPRRDPAATPPAGGQ